MRTAFIIAFLSSLLNNSLAQQNSLCATNKVYALRGEFTPQVINCDSLYDLCNYYLDYKNRLAYDTGKYHIEHCYAQPNSYGEFDVVYTAAVNLLNAGDTVIAACRDWLKSVLYLNNTKKYYCADLENYALLFASRDEYGHHVDYKTSLAIWSFLADSLNCFRHSRVSEFIRDYHSYWQDTVKDSLKTPFDSTILPLDSVGQGFIRVFHNAVSPISPSTGELIASFNAIQNPFEGEVELRYKLNRENLTRIEVFDALGKPIWSEGQGYHQPGDCSVKIPTKKWASGMYYARLSTFSNETRTIKLIHE